MIILSAPQKQELRVTTTCNLITVAALLLHSIFGCSLDHACVCESHVHGEHQHAQNAAGTGACEHDHSGHHDETPCDDNQKDEIASPETMITSGCDCCQKGPCDDGDSPCCSEVQCSFITANDVALSLVGGPALLGLADVDRSRLNSRYTRCRAEMDRRCVGLDNSLARCALHCSWQI